MSNPSEAEVVAKAVGLKVRQMLTDYWPQIVQAGQDHEQGLAKISMAVAIHTVHSNSPHSVTVTIPLGKIRETRMIDMDDLEAPGGEPTEADQPEDEATSEEVP